MLLAEKNRRVIVVERAPAVGGFFPLLDRQFPTNSCGVCFMSPRPPAYCPIYESELHENIELLTYTELRSVAGEPGDFKLTCEVKPRFVDVDKCTRCGRCAEVCPVEIESEFGGGVEKRKAAYLPFPQALPRSYLIDAQACTRCGECVKACPAGAVNLDEAAQERRIEAGAVVLAFGFETFHGEHKGEYGFGRYANVVSSIQYERMLSFSGPTGGLPGRPSDGERPKRVAFIQCVGSRDPACGKGYCSSICCMYATKQAVVSRERDAGLETTVFYMDIRAMGKDYERYYDDARKKRGVRYLRSAVSTIRELQQDKRLVVQYGLDDGSLKEETFDMVVLSLGFTPPANVRSVADALGVRLNEDGFCQTEEFRPTATNVPGVFVAGAFREPRDIPETVVDASCAAADVSALLDQIEPVDPGPPATTAKKLPETFRIGVFLCDDKGALAETLAVDVLRECALAEPDVVLAEPVGVASLKQAAAGIVQRITDERLDRVVLAGHRGMTLRKRLDRAVADCVFECANIGEQCANVHLEDSDMATAKAMGLLRAAVAKARGAAPKQWGRKPLNTGVLVVGGGITGMTSALALGDQGFKVTLVEKSEILGGNAREAHYTLKGSDVPALVDEIVGRVESHSAIEVLLGAELGSLEGTWGKYRAGVRIGEEAPRVIEHGALIVATGAKPVVPDEYLFGEDSRVLTQRELEQRLADGSLDTEHRTLKTVVMIQCVGSRDDKRPYCSRVCCTHAVKNLLKLKALNPDVAVYVLYRDVRTYGFYESYYHDARSRGALFIRYEPENKPRVTANGGSLKVSFLDPVAGDAIDVEPDLLVLSSGIEPREDSRQLGEIAGLAVNADGFFAEANPKSAPLDAVDRGKYFCGLCHSPNHIEDAICQGKAAAARASALLWEGYGDYAENQAHVNERRCSGCGLCVSACPYEARFLDAVTGKARVHEDLCKGCGTCVVTCPNAASEQYNFERVTLLDVLDTVVG